MTENGEGQLDQQRTRHVEKFKRQLSRVIDQLEDPATEDIVLNPSGELWVKKKGTGFEIFGRMNESTALSAFGTLATLKDTVINFAHPILETELPDGSRFEGLRSPIVTAPTFAIRCRPRQIFTLEDYATARILTHKNDPFNTRRERDSFLQQVAGKDHLEIIRLAVQQRKNILIVGATGSGKTTLANAVLHEIAKATPNDRVILIEDTAELQCSVGNSVALNAGVGAVTMLDCLRVCMRLIPKRIIVGEVRGGEAHALLKAWNTGHPGGLATVHANDAISGLRRLEALIAEATSSPQQTLIAEAVDLVMFIDATPERRKIRELAVVLEHREDRYVVEYI
jgi:Flp pilus assembly CpaF family ATPase